MMSVLATWLLRLYPATWRIRYEEEVRSLLEDKPPGLRDLLGLASAAVRERLHVIVDPSEHPVLAPLIEGFGGWFARSAVLGLAATPAVMFVRSLGPAPDWVFLTVIAALPVITFRALLAQPFLGSIDVLGRTIRTGPLSGAECRMWWGVLWLVVVFESWAGRPAGPPFPLWSNCVLFLQLASPAAWQRARATTELRRLHREMTAAVREHVRLANFAARGLATMAEVDEAVRAIGRIHAETTAAGREFRRARLVHRPPDRPLGL